MTPFGIVPVDDARRILGLNAASVYNFDLQKLQPLADRFGPTPAELGQTADVELEKWKDVEAAGRPWLSGVEALPVTVSE